MLVGPSPVCDADPPRARVTLLCGLWHTVTMLPVHAFARHAQDVRVAEGNGQLCAAAAV